MTNAAAAFAVFDAPNSRRGAARAVHANGANNGASPLPPVANQDNTSAPTPRTEAEAAAARGAAITGALGTTTLVATAAAGRAALSDDSPPAGTAGCQGVAVSAMPTDGDEPAAGPVTAGATDGTTTVGADGEVSELRRTGAGTPAAAEPLRRVDGAAESSEDLAAGLDRREGTAGLVDVEESADPEPTEPAEPVVSANAIGIAARAEPTPKATASAPTRPT